MKKILVLLVFAVVVALLTGCGGSSSSDANLRDYYKDIWEIDTKIVDEEDTDYYLIWKNEKEGFGKLIYEYNEETKQEEPLFYIYSDLTGVYYSYISENEPGKIEYVKVIDFYNKEWKICDNIQGSLVEVNYDEGYCVVKAQGETETVYYLYDINTGLVYEYNYESKMKIIIIKNPKFVKIILKLIYKIKKHKN